MGAWSRPRRSTAGGKSGIRTTLGSTTNAEVNPPCIWVFLIAMLQLLDGDARNNERDCGCALHPMGVQAGKVVNEGKSGTSRDLGETELPRVGDAVDLYLRDVGGSEIDVRVEQDVATLRFKAEAGIGAERDIHPTSPLNQAHGADAAGDAEGVVGQLDYVGRWKG